MASEKLYRNTLIPFDTKVNPMPIDTAGFKSFGVTAANQEMSVPTHITKDYAIRENSSSLDPNIWEIQLSFLKLFAQRFSPIHDV